MRRSPCVATAIESFGPAFGGLPPGDCVEIELAGYRAAAFPGVSGMALEIRAIREKSAESSYILYNILMVHVIASIRCKDGKRPDVLRAFNEMLPKVLGETGCIVYEPTIDMKTDIARQVPAGDDIITMVERWRSLDDLKAHLEAPHMKEFRSRHGSLIESTDLRITEAG